MNARATRREWIGLAVIAIGVWISSFPAGAAIGPVVGGALLQLFWWGSVFLVAVPRAAGSPA